jgi:hypothetical protein
VYSVWNMEHHDTSHTHKTQVQVEHRVEHLHQELNSLCGTVILQLEQWAHLAPVPLTNAECSYTNSDFLMACVIFLFLFRILVGIAGSGEVAGGSQPKLER